MSEQGRQQSNCALIDLAWVFIVYLYNIGSLLIVRRFVKYLMIILKQVLCIKGVGSG